VKALFDFSPQPEDKNQLPFKEGDRLAIIDKTGDSWWKAIDGRKIGYVPKNFVAPL
jgi:hypothetical protein